MKKGGLESGVRLGPYEIAASLGAGGMGEVYKARDTRLNRAVAIKVLPLRLMTPAQALERFQREARAISALDHPHICSLFDMGEANGVDFLVMPYLDGETLQQRLARGPFDVLALADVDAGGR
jgi:serine/threonine protein kinase